MSDHPELLAVERRRRVRSIAVLAAAVVLGLVLAPVAWMVVGWVCAAVWGVLLP